MWLRHSFLPALIAGLALPGLTQDAGAPSTMRLYFPPVSLASGETAQLNVAAVPTGSSYDVSCSGSILVSNPGGPVDDPLPFTVSPGQIFSAAFPNNSESRSSLLPTILQNMPSSQGSDSARCLFSLELFSNTTHVVLSSPTPVLAPR